MAGLKIRQKPLNGGSKQKTRPLARPGRSRMRWFAFLPKARLTPAVLAGLLASGVLQLPLPGLHQWVRRCSRYRWSVPTNETAGHSGGTAADFHCLPYSPDTDRETVGDRCPAPEPVLCISVKMRAGDRSTTRNPSLANRRHVRNRKDGADANRALPVLKIDIRSARRVGDYRPERDALLPE